VFNLYTEKDELSVSRWRL